MARYFQPDGVIHAHFARAADMSQNSVFAFFENSRQECFMIRWLVALLLLVAATQLSPSQVSISSSAARGESRNVFGYDGLCSRGLESMEVVYFAFEPAPDAMIRSKGVIRCAIWNPQLFQKRPAGYKHY